jgi:hypothetical protein
LYVLNQAPVICLFAGGYLGAPALILWGWTRLSVARVPISVGYLLSLTGFFLVNASAVGALLMIATAQASGGSTVATFRVWKWGAYIGVLGFAFALAGLGRRSPLRWISIGAALGAVSFWLAVTAFID